MIVRYELGSENPKTAKSEIYILKL
jgi:hypothetical protein